MRSELGTKEWTDDVLSNWSTFLYLPIFSATVSPISSGDPTPTEPRGKGWATEAGGHKLRIAGPILGIGGSPSWAMAAMPIIQGITRCYCVTILQYHIIFLSINQSVNQASNQSINRSVDLSIYQSIHLYPTSASFCIYCAGTRLVRVQNCACMGCLLVENYQRHPKAVG